MWALAKKRTICQYVDFIVKVFEENPKTSFPGGERGYRMPIKESEEEFGLPHISEAERIQLEVAYSAETNQSWKEAYSLETYMSRKQTGAFASKHVNQ